MGILLAVSATGFGAMTDKANLSLFLVAVDVPQGMSSVLSADNFTLLKSHS
ncbi:hypothetical protein [Pseudosulfitobacter sp. SM2401]|uniref:hypothetical protein n=1 Tax=Pseudosulfitobacter sp. SM2401 TaxID=3350098 RepID=UPI0036F415D5